jgi:hypothetical protein
MIDNVDGAFALRRADFGDDQPVFAAVQAQGRLDGVLFALTLRQTYCVGPAELATRCFITTFGWIPMAQSLGIQSNGYQFLGD